MARRFKSALAICFIGLGLMELTRWDLIEGSLALFGGLILFPGWTRILVTLGLLDVDDGRSELLASVIGIALFALAIQL